MPTPTSIERSTGAHMIAADGRPLPLLGVELEARACAGLARVTLRQRFHNPHEEPLRVRYLVPLPADAAVGGYCFELPDERIVGEIARKHEARERFERALVEGRSAALLEQQRSSVFEQEVGNIPPGAVVATELTIDQPLAWLSEGAWEWRFPTVIAPRFMGADGRVPDAGKIEVGIADGSVAAAATLKLTIADAIEVAPRSPSHALTSSSAPEGLIVGLDEEGARLDRDVVIRWGVAAHEPGVSVSLARRPGDRQALGLLTIVPPTPEHREAVARDLIVLIDVSGSMGGEPLAQAKRVLTALVAGLAPHDRLEMIAFASRPIPWRRGPVSCDAATLRDAERWIAKLHASGGTQMRDAILEALAPLRDDAQRQILLISDGLIGFEQEIIAEVVNRLPSRSRVHCLGVGHGVNRSLTRPLARAGHGVERIVAPGEDVEPAVAALLERTAEPLIVAVELEGPALGDERPVRAGSGARGDLFAGTPARIALACAPEGGRLTVRGRSAAGAWVEDIEIPAIPEGQGDPAVIRHCAREQVEDVETLIAAGLARDGDARIEALGLQFGIATRMTSWIAVSSRATVDPTTPTRTVEQPHELAAGMSAEGLGLRPALAAAPMQARARERAVARAQRAPLAKPAPASPSRIAALPAAPPLSASAGGRGRMEPPTEILEAKPEVADEYDADLEFSDDYGARPPRLLERLGAALGFAKPREVAATIVLEDARRLVLAFVTPSAIDWSLPKLVELRIGGRELRVRVDLTATTKPAKLGAGLSVRLAFELESPLPSGGPLTLEVAGLRLTAVRQS